MIVMAVAGSLWVFFTLLGAVGQVARNALQRGLTETLGMVGATHVRFLFGLPFGLLFLALTSTVTGVAVPVPGPEALAAIIIGALAQIAATALMLAAMREKSFVVSTALIKTEPVHAALFGLAVLGDWLTAGLALAIGLAMAGVYLMSWPKGLGRDQLGGRAVLYGLAAAALFGVSAVGYRAGILALGSPSFVVAASTALAIALTFQTVLLTGWLAAFDRRVLRDILASWRPSLAAGFSGAAASQFWFLAFAIAPVAQVRTLALVEILFAQAVSRRIFSQAVTGREIAGMALIAAGVAVLLNL